MGDIKIRPIDFTEWQTLWPKCQKASLLQSWIYGISKKSKKVSIKYYAIVSQDTVISIVQVLVKNFPLFGSAARINRGPAILDNVNPEQRIKISIETIKLIIQECKKMKWWVFQIAPDLPLEENISKELQKIGLTKLPIVPWASALLPLKGSEEEILMSVKGRWRRHLRKGINEGISVSLVENTKENIDKFIENYRDFKLEKNFDGVSIKLLKAMSLQNRQKYWAFNIFQAHATKHDGTKNLLGYFSSVEHGDTAIYLTGTTTVEGRKFNTNYVLMWEAIIQARRNGCKWFDVGGLNEATIEGISQFKSGLKGQPYTLIGEWRRFIFPKL